MMIVSHSMYEMQRVQVIVGNNTAASIVNLELNSLKTNYKQLINDLAHSLSTNSNALLIFGICSLSFATILILISVYYKFKINKSRKSTNASATKTNGFHRYNQLAENNSDDEASSTRMLKPINNDLKIQTKLKYTNSNELDDNQKLLSNFTDEEDDDANCDKIFVR
jgi:hypothetical protein